MADQPQQPLRRLLPLIEGGDNEKLANLLAGILGRGEGASKLALGIMVGLQDYLDYGDIKRVEMTWIPPQVFEALRSKHKQDLAAVAAEAAQMQTMRLKSGDAHGARIYGAVCDITAKLIERQNAQKPPADAG